MNEKKDTNAAWDAHWQSGALSSLTSGDKTAEAPEAIAAWNDFFRKLAKGANILDIATGNGIIPAHASAFAREFNTGFKITGIDQADIDPLGTGSEQKALLEDVTFLGRIDAEDLPFEDEMFDAVTGQYAIEYTTIIESASEVARVLKPGGHFRFVCHASDGGVVTFNVPKARQCNWLLEESGVLEALRDATRAAFENTPDRDEKRTTFRDCAVKARTRLAEMGENQEIQDLLNNLVQIYINRDQFKDYNAFEGWVLGIYNQIAGQVAMISALEDAALDREGIENLSDQLGRVGFDDLTISKLHAGQNKTLLAWQIEGVKG